jgi:hypothetical protein
MTPRSATSPPADKEISMNSDRELQDQLRFARDAEPTEREIAAVQRAARSAVPLGSPRPRGISRRAAIVAALALLMPAAALAISSGGDALTSFLGLADSAPSTLDLRAGTVIDEQDAITFTITRNDSDDVCLSLDGVVGICDDPHDEDWARQLRDHAVAPIGTIPPRAGPDALIPLFVLSAPDAERVEVHYRSGAPTVTDVGRGGAIITVDGERAPQAVVARDRNGAELGRSDISGRQWTWCYDPDGCG